MVKRLISYFFEGLLYVAPLGVTLYVIYSLFIFIDGLLIEYITSILGVKIPGIGFILLLFALILIGFIGRTIIAKPMKYLFGKIIDHIPFLKFIYTALNDVFTAFVGKEKKFNKPVLVKVNMNSDLEKLGFVTEENLEILNEKDKVAVYFPHSYNFSGELFIVPTSNIKYLDVKPGEVMKFIVSAGLTGWEEIKE
jgi:uncharacterized membrane protein